MGTSLTHSCANDAPIPGRRRGFTLIEVLVVVAIIALLVAILLPTLKGARDQARRAACASQLHQIGMALHMYGQENGYFPAAGNGSNLWWPTRLMRQLEDQHEIFWCPSAPIWTFWDGKKELINQKPKDVDPPHPDKHYTFSYGINDWGVGDTGEAVTKTGGLVRLGLGAYAGDPEAGELKVDRVKRPSEMIAIGDNDVSEDDLDKLAIIPNIIYWFDGVIDPWEKEEGSGNRHRGGANIVFVDAHVEWIRQEDAIAPDPGMRQRWNYDYDDHCEFWNDLPPEVWCPDA